MAVLPVSRGAADRNWAGSGSQQELVVHGPGNGTQGNQIPKRDSRRPDRRHGHQTAPRPSSSTSRAQQPQPTDRINPRATRSARALSGAERIGRCEGSRRWPPPRFRLWKRLRDADHRDSAHTISTASARALRFGDRGPATSSHMLRCLLGRLTPRTPGRWHRTAQRHPRRPPHRCGVPPRRGAPTRRNESVPLRPRRTHLLKPDGRTLTPRIDDCVLVSCVGLVDVSHDRLPEAADTRNVGRIDRDLDELDRSVVVERGRCPEPELRCERGNPLGSIDLMRRHPRRRGVLQGQHDPVVPEIDAQLRTGGRNRSRRNSAPSLSEATRTHVVTPPSTYRQPMASTALKICFRLSRFVGSIAPACRSARWTTPQFRFQGTSTILPVTWPSSASSCAFAASSSGTACSTWTVS